MKKILSDKDFNNIEEVKKSGVIPEHIAIIMDGNGRWAKMKGLPRVAGHKKGVETVREIVEACANLGVKFLTLYTFSTENWHRPKTEVSTLMRLIVKSLKDETNALHKNNIRLTSIGNSEMLPVEVKEELEEAFEKTKMNTKMTLNLALSYSGRWEITNAVKNIAQNVKDGNIDVENISEDTVAKYLNTSEMPDPELVIRSGGEMRISNFLLWQIAYSEIYVTEILWPKFKTSNLIEAIKEFQRRERRFGLVSEQINEDKKKIGEND
ncbi:MAG: isoprenyl transferase [Bacteroidetes bacterium]|nr:isoprenyl transferase [Bacteroidota bacterium]MBU1114106.1 isoprenyl transferase [Bacteroidota bacterium]MBU1800179.1 isoprenyl transferase [Bacteroidota bacterium]